MLSVSVMDDDDGDGNDDDVCDCLSEFDLECDVWSVEFGMVLLFGMFCEDGMCDDLDVLGWCVSVREVVCEYGWVFGVFVLLLVVMMMLMLVLFLFLS